MVVGMISVMPNIRMVVGMIPVFSKKKERVDVLRLVQMAQQDAALSSSISVCLW